MRSNVAVIGFTPHAYGAPWGHPDWDFKGLNDLHQVFEQYWPKCFAEHSDQVQWYQLHRRGADGLYPGARDENHSKWLTEQKCPIWMWEHDDAIPASVPYPLLEILTMPHPVTGDELWPEKYFNNSITWMIAHAILQGYQTIGLYGIDMAMDGVHGQSEYQHQRPSVENAIGVARGLGIRVVMPQESEILKCAYLYGLDNMMHFRKKLLVRHDGLVQDEAAAVNDYETSKRALFQVKGALQLLCGQTGSPMLNKLREHIPADLAKEAQASLENDETVVQNQNEAAKCHLHEVRGAKHQTEWELKNYFPGEGPLQDVPRTDGSIVLESAPVAAPALEPSDGKQPKKKPKNRIAELVKE